MRLHHSGSPLVDDDFKNPPNFGTGYQKRDYQAWPLNAQPYNRTPTVKRLTEQEIIEKIIEKTADKTWLIDLMDQAGVKPKNQQKSSFCHVHAPVGLMEDCIAISGEPPKVLSAFFAGSQITGGRDEGGSGVRDVKYLVEHGTCLESLWAPMKFKGTEAEVAAAKANAQFHKIEICEEFETDDLVGIYSSLCANQGVTVGVSSWSHEVGMVALVFKTDKSHPTFGDIRPKFRNSWGDWGTDGCGVLDGSKMRWDEVMRVAQVTMSKD